MIVYVATNTINGKIYIGKTVRTLSHAKARHKQRALKQWKYGCNSRFYTALRKYGFDSFSFEVLYNGSSDAEIQAKEREYIALLKATDPDHGYNMTPGGDGGAGKKLSDSQKALLSERFSGENNPCHGKFGKDHPAAGHKKSPEAIERIRQAHLGKPKSEEHRRKLSEARKRMAAEKKALQSLSS